MTNSSTSPCSNLPYAYLPWLRYPYLSLVSYVDYITLNPCEFLSIITGLGDNMQSDSDEWQRWFDSEMPETAKLPGDYQKTIANFDRLILLRAMRPDRVTTALKSWIEEMMGKEYVFQRPFDMTATFQETSNRTPTFFVLFAGVRY